MQAEEDREAAETTPGEPGTPRRRRHPLIPLVLLAAVLGGGALLLIVRSSPAQQVRRLIDKQIKLTIAGRYDQVWQDTLSLQAKKACPKDAFTGALDQLRSSQQEFWSLIEYRDLRIQVTGSRAVVTYVILYNGAPIERATAANPDIYRRASRTVFGPTLSVAQQLENLDHLKDQAIVVGKEYEKERASIIKHGPIRLVESSKGQWYDDVDSHVRCG